MYIASKAEAQTGLHFSCCRVFSNQDVCVKLKRMCFMPDYYILDQCIPWETFIVFSENATTGSGRVGYELCACPHGSICFHGVVVSMLNYKFICLGSDPGLGSCHAAHPTVYSPFWVINCYLVKPGR